MNDTSTDDGVATPGFSMAPSTDVYDNMTTDGNLSMLSDPYWDQLPFAHKYWRQFNIAGIPDAYHHAVALWMTFFGIVGVLGNLLVISTFLRARHLRTPPNMLIVNLAVSDLGFSAVNGFPLLTIASINKIWTWGHLCCQLYGFTGGLCGFVSIHTLAVIAYDRYKVVARPLEVARNLSKKKTGLSIVLVWAWCLGWALPPLFGWGAYVTEGFHTSCSFDYLTRDLNNTTYIIGMYFFAFMVPVSIIAVCYIGIVRAIFKHHAEMLATARSMGATVSKGDAEKKQEIQAAKVSAMSVGTFLLSWVPYATVALIGMVYPHEDKMVTPYMSEIPVMFAKASASYNPIIYAISHPKFRAEIDKTFPWLLCCCKPAPKPQRVTSASVSRSTSVMSKTEADSSADVAMTTNPAANPAAK